MILGPLEDLQCDPAIIQGQQKKLSLIHKNTIRLLNLVKQILEFRKTETQNKKLCVVQEDIIEKVKEIGLKYKELNRNPDVTFEIEISTPHTLLYFDPEVITMILDNLLSNAFKYTHTGKIALTVRAVRVDEVEYTEFNISDTGIGIPEEDLSYIFERYYQSNKQRKIPGVGIGLALVKNLVHLHQGTIFVTSKPDGGSAFTFRLLTHNTYPDAIHLDTVPQDPEEEKINKPIVLIVEDDHDIRDYIAGELQNSYEVIVAENGEQGVEAAFTTVPDIIVSDIMMPGKDGIELCKEIKSSVATSHIPIILLTARDTLQDKTEGYNVGADSYITKPFSASLLRSRITNLLETRKKIASLIFAGASFSLKHSIIQDSLNSIDNEFLEKITKIVEENLMDEKIDIPSIADQLSMSYSSLYRKIKALTGMSTSEFVRKLRMKKAEQLFLSGKYNISEIAHQVGFQSLSYFRECFKEEFGMSPSEYMKKIKEG
ncbi:MAG: response regulator [Bacteroides sp.]|nr:response regulator [Bacteroides sp.]